MFRNYGDRFLEVFQPHLERLVKDTSHDKHDSSQRCAMEVLSGLIRGSKHWPFEKVPHLAGPEYYSVHSFLSSVLLPSVIYSAVHLSAVL